MMTNIDERIMNGKEVLERLEDNGTDYLLPVRGFKIIKQDLEQLKELRKNHAKLLVQIAHLEEENEKLEKENDKLAKECEEWADCVAHNDKAHLFFINNQVKLIEKLEKIIEILKRKNIRTFTRECLIDGKKVVTFHLCSDYNTYNLTKEEYELLEVFRNAKD